MLRACVAGPRGPPHLPVPMRLIPSSPEDGNLPRQYWSFPLVTWSLFLECEWTVEANGEDCVVKRSCWVLRFSGLFLLGLSQGDHFNQHRRDLHNHRGNKIRG